MIKSQQGLVPEIIKSQSKKVSFSWGSSKPTNSYTGFPLKFFEDQTYLERIAEWFVNAPRFLSKNVLENKDPVFRMKQVIKMVFSTLYMTVKPSKPFNPFLGETY